MNYEVIICLPHAHACICMHTHMHKRTQTHTQARTTEVQGFHQKQRSYGDVSPTTSHKSEVPSGHLDVEEFHGGSIFCMSPEMVYKEHAYFKFWISYVSRFFFMLQSIVLSFVQLSPGYLLCRSTEQNKKYICSFSRERLQTSWPHFELRIFLSFQNFKCILFFQHPHQQLTTACN